MKRLCFITVVGVVGLAMTSTARWAAAQDGPARETTDEVTPNEPRLDPASSDEPGLEPTSALPEPPTTPSVDPSRVDPRIPADIRAAAPLSHAHHLDFMPAEVQSAAFAPDNRTIYVHLHERTIDLWRLLIAWRREIGGGVLLLAWIAMALAARRILERRQRVGQFYCRKCNYDVAAHVVIPAAGAGPIEIKPDAKCPECGVDLGRVRPLRGRRTWPRLWPMMCVWVVLTCAYGYLWTAWFARSGAQDWVQGWNSRWLARMAAEHDIKRLSTRTEDTDKVIEVDLATGRTIRTVLRRSTRTYSELALSPDGKTIIMDAAGRGHVTAYSASTGKRVRSVSLWGQVAYDVSQRSVVGWSKDSGIAYIPWFNRDQNIGGVGEWNLRTGQVRELFRTPGYVRPPENHTFGRQFLLLGSAEPPRFVSWPSFMEAFPTKTFKIRFHAEGEPEQEFSPSPMPAWKSNPAVTPDGKTLFFIVGYGESLLGFDTATGKVIGTVPARMAGGNETVALDAAGRRLVIDGTPLLVRDIVERRWISRLTEPDGLYGPEPLISPDGRWVAAVMQRNLPGKKFWHDLVVWKIDESPGPAPAPAVAAP